MYERIVHTFVYTVYIVICLLRFISIIFLCITMYFIQASLIAHASWDSIHEFKNFQFSSIILDTNSNLLTFTWNVINQSTKRNNSFVFAVVNFRGILVCEKIGFSFVSFHGKIVDFFEILKNSSIALDQNFAENCFYFK